MVKQDKILDLDTKDLEKILKARKKEEKELKISFNTDKLMRMISVFAFWVAIGILVLIKLSSIDMFLISGILAFIHFEMVFNDEGKNSKKN